MYRPLHNFSFRGWHYWLVITLMLSLFINILLDSHPVFAAACGIAPDGRCFLGRAINVANYGSQAQIGTTNANNTAFVSFMLVQSRSNDIFIQTGWTKQPATMGVVWAFWESHRCGAGRPANCYVSNFYDPSFGGGGITGDNNYYNDFNPASSGYWCHGFGATACFSSETAASVGMGSGAYPQAGTVAFYGETNDTTAPMGGANAANAIYILNPRYKVNLNGSVGAGPYVQVAGNSYANSDPNGNCGFNPCPYNYNWSFPETVLDIWIWTR